MIEAHTLDAWTLHADRDSVSYRYLMVLGGFAAPLFLFLAGIAVPFAAHAALKKTGGRLAAFTAVPMTANSSRFNPMSPNTTSP